MIALPFHPCNAVPIAELNRDAREILGRVDDEARKLFGAKTRLRLADKIGGGRRASRITLSLKGLTEDERRVILDGCLINVYNGR
ncbi:MAG: hypothetical protein LBQ10_09525 [Desulfovibrio sp.]|jgi:hypothetical protein|nr:hypothetical protein [Desulfovibrio sp.]